MASSDQGDSMGHHSGPAIGDRLQPRVAQRVASHATEGSTYHFQPARTTDGHANQGKPVEESANVRKEQSPSPPRSTATTTGTATTPGSISNHSHDGRDHHLSNERRDSNTPQPHQSGSVESPYASSQPYGPTDGSDSLYATGSNSPDARYNPANYPCAVKLLVSNNVAGSIIGRSGQTISELQSQSLTRIKLSQTGDYYPGTQDRVCLVQGETGHVKSALRLVVGRLYMLQEQQHSQNMAWQLQRQRGDMGPPFDFVVRLLIPSSACGMVIGKAGVNIKLMEETFGVVSVRLSPKDNVAEAGYPSAAIISATSERVVTVTSPSLDSCLPCLYHIVDGMTSHPEISRYANMTTSYARIVPEIAGYGPQPPGAASSRPMMVPMPSPPCAPRQTTTPDHWDNLPRRILSSPDIPGVMSGYHRLAGGEPLTPDAARLAGYGMMSFSPVAGGPAPQPHPQPPPPPHMPMDSDAGGGVHHSNSAPDVLATQLEQNLHISPSHQSALLPHTTAPMQHCSPSSGSTGTAAASAPAFQFSPMTPTMIAPGSFHAQVSVPDSMIGSILGRQGRTLTELQVLSGTRIRCSQRGEYLPGTRHRIINIRGPTAHSVWQVQYMMEQRMVLPPTAYHEMEQQQMSPAYGAPTTAGYHGQQQQQHPGMMAAPLPAPAASSSSLHHHQPSTGPPTPPS